MVGQAPPYALGYIPDVPEYRRLYQPGGTYFFTLVTEGRMPLFADPIRREMLGNAMRAERRRRPFETVAAVLLPDHLHALWRLPDADHDFSARWSAIKADFTRRHLAAGGPEARRSAARVRQEHRGVWQRRFWEHRVRDDRDLAQHADYIHYNPVHHGHATCPHNWPATTFGRWVRSGVLTEDWCCTCHDRPASPPPFGGSYPEL